MIDINVKTKLLNVNNAKIQESNGKDHMIRAVIAFLYFSF